MTGHLTKHQEHINQHWSNLDSVFFRGNRIEAELFDLKVDLQLKKIRIKSMLDKLYKCGDTVRNWEAESMGSTELEYKGSVLSYHTPVVSEEANNTDADTNVEIPVPPLIDTRRSIDLNDLSPAVKNCCIHDDPPTFKVLVPIEEASKAFHQYATCGHKHVNHNHWMALGTGGFHPYNGGASQHQGQGSQRIH